MRKKSNIVGRILNNNLCTGCGICSNISSSIKMKYDEEGYIRPYIMKELNLNEEKIIENICPGMIVKHKKINSDYDLFLGPVFSIYKGYSSNDIIRNKCSSGGAISSIAIYLLESKQIDYVIHIGPSNNWVQNELKISNTAKEVLNNCGSRYSPSAPLENIDDLLNKPYRYLFIGKPCDISALKRYSEYNKDVKDKIIYTFSFFCAGVPSIKGTKKILNNLNIEEENIKYLSYRGNGWPGSFMVKNNNGDIKTLSYQDSWGKILGRTVQFRCKICADGTGEFSDLSFGDAWYLDKNNEPQFEEKEGRNFIISRNSNGESLIQKCIKENIIIMENKTTSSEVALCQPSQFARKKSIYARIKALKFLLVDYPKYSMKPIKTLSKTQSFYKNFRQFIGTIKRRYFK